MYITTPQLSVQRAWSGVIGSEGVIRGYRFRGRGRGLLVQRAWSGGVVGVIGSEGVVGGYWFRGRGRGRGLG